MKQHLDRLKEKPEHVRHRIALGATSAITGLVGIVWITTLAATGAFALAPAGGRVAEGGESSAEVALSSTNIKSNFSQLAGALGAATGATSSEPTLTIVEGNAHSTFDPKPEATSRTQTSIPF